LFALVRITASHLDLVNREVAEVDRERRIVGLV
jgi:hypothetical protein